MKRVLTVLGIVSAFLLGQAVVASSAGSQDLTTLLANFLYNGTLGRALLFSPNNTYDIGASGTTSPRNIYAANGVVSSGDMIAGSAGAFYWTSGSLLRSSSDGVLKVSNNAETDFSRLQFGGITSSFPSLKRSGNALQVRLADDSAYATIIGAFGGGAGALLIGATAPTISSGFGTSPSVTASNGTAAFTVNVGTGGSASAGVLGLPAATTGWNCFADDQTTPGVNVTKETASTTTTATLTNYNSTTGIAAAWAASDTLRVSCFAY